MPRHPIFKAIQDIRAFFILDHDRREKYLYKPDRCFTRNSPLLFSRTVLLVLGLLRNSMSIELFDFFGRLDIEAVTKSAFCQRRQLIKPAFFRDLFVLTADAFYKRFKAKRWKGFRLIAIDGTGFRLPIADQVGETFGWHGNQHNRVPSIRGLLGFDVLNKIIYNVEHHCRRTSEVRIAYSWIPELPKDTLAIYDRGFHNHAIPWLHSLYGTHCIIRIKTTQSKLIRDFVKSTEKQMITEVNPHYRARLNVQREGTDIDHTASITVRLVKVILPNGEVEVLMTTLLDKRKYPARLFAKLYDLRWGVETAIFCIKSYGQLTKMSSYKPVGIEQDIWAQYAMYNIQSMLITAKEQEIAERSKKRKHPAAINRNVTLGLIKRSLPGIFLDPRRKWKAKVLVLLDRLLRYLEAKRPRPSRPRNRKILRAQGRHIYEHNYRSTL